MINTTRSRVKTAREVFLLLRTYSKFLIGLISEIYSACGQAHDGRISEIYETNVDARFFSPLSNPGDSSCLSVLLNQTQ